MSALSVKDKETVEFIEEQKFNNGTSVHADKMTN